MESFEIEQSYEEDERVAAEKHMDPGLYLAAINGDLYPFKRILNGISTRDPKDDILSSLNPVGNTFLHVAAKHGKQDIVKSIATAKPSLVLAKNFNGETVLHLAAKHGDELMVKALLEILSHNETEKHDLLMAENEMGNTALDQALISGRESIASYLIQQDYELSYHLNKHGESALYLAAKAGFVECVSSILAQCTDENRLNLLFKNKSPFQAAIERNNIVVLEAIINAKPGLIQMRDNEGRNPLHFAASLGHLKGAHYLLQNYHFNATRRDKRGGLPIHLAALEGHADIIRILLNNFPEADALLDMSGCNILHIAAQSGRYNVFHFILKNPKFKSLINMKDKFGNTPLHTACNNYHPKIVSTLTRDKRVDISAVNNKGMTALDVSYANNSDNIPLRQRLTWAALKAASVPQHFSNREDSAAKTANAHANGRVNTLLVVATLVATVTFAAGFTMPGGYSSENGTDLGMATMWRHTVFHIFVICDTIAMYTTSFVVVTALIWAKLGDNTLVLIALDLVAPLLGFALIMMSMAFTAGVVTVVTKLRWLQIALFAMGVVGISFIALLLILLLPLCASLTSRCRMLRYLSYYPFHLLVLLSYFTEKSLKSEAPPIPHCDTSGV
ncbi:protein ACCELERATED CELL DEATH 6-like [Salvia splendens]|nr:protein ACCELERATED CELL DEATH 6-like [Salvia splendens]